MLGCIHAFIHSSIHTFIHSYIHTKDYEASVRVRGTQRILSRAAVHGTIERGRHSLQNELPPLSLDAAVQQVAPYPRPGEEGLREHLILSIPSPEEKRK